MLPPIIDMHMHASDPTSMSKYLPKAISTVTTEEALIKQR